VINPNRLIKTVLWLALCFNIFGAFLFAFPASKTGQLAGLPADVPVAYRAILAAFVLLFAGAYAWLALQPEPVRPLLAFSAIGKTTIFLLVVILWLTSQTPASSVFAASIDLGFAAIFTWWLIR
jgi:hypothetical protein